MRPGISGGGPVAADKQEGTWLPFEGFFGIVAVFSNWSLSAPIFSGFVTPGFSKLESKALPCCELGVIWEQAAVVKRFPFGFSSDSCSMLILEVSSLISLGFNDCSELVKTGVELAVDTGESTFCSSIMEVPFLEKPLNGSNFFLVDCLCS